MVLTRKALIGNYTPAQAAVFVTTLLKKQNLMWEWMVQWEKVITVSILELEKHFNESL